MVFLLGVAMLVAGVWLCLAGEVNLPGGRLVKAQRAQIAGVILLGFFPLYFVTFRLFRDWDDTAKLILNWSSALFCLVAALVILLRSSKTTQPQMARPFRLSSEKAPFADASEDKPEDQEPISPVRSASNGKNPFDFS